MATEFDDLRRERLERHLTQRELAQLAGISEDALAAYESGRRRPRREALLRLCRGLGLARQATNEILANAGYDPEISGPLRIIADRRRSLAGAEAALETWPWAVLLLTETFEVVGWNPAAAAVAEADFSELTALPQRHLIELAASGHFAARLQNWDELMGRLVSFWKRDEAFDVINREPPPFLTRLLNDVAASSPGHLARLMKLWGVTQAMPESERSIHPVVWRSADGTTLRFDAVMRFWSEFECIYCFDWHPADAATARWLQARLASGNIPGEGRAGLDRSLAEPGAASWSDLLREQRERAGWSRRTLAMGAGISEQTLYSYETGRRRPSRRAVLALTSTLGVDALSVNAILEALGMPPEPSMLARWMCGLVEIPHATGISASGMPRPQLWSEVQNEGNRYPWPITVFDWRCSFVAANGPAQDVLLPGRLETWASRHLLDIVSDRPFRERAVNWEEVVGAMLPRSLKPFLNPAACPPGASQAFTEAARRVRKQAPGVLAELVERWDRGSFEPETSRVVFPLGWQHEDGTRLNFDCVISGWAPMDPVWVIDWHPADGLTWDWLDEKASQKKLAARA